MTTGQTYLAEERKSSEIVIPHFQEETTTISCEETRQPGGHHKEEMVLGTNITLVPSEVHGDSNELATSSLQISNILKVIRSKNSELVTGMGKLIVPPSS